VSMHSETSSTFRGRDSEGRPRLGLHFLLPLPPSTVPPVVITLHAIEERSPGRLFILRGRLASRSAPDAEPAWRHRVGLGGPPWPHGSRRRLGARTLCGHGRSWPPSGRGGAPVRGGRCQATQQRRRACRGLGGRKSVSRALRSPGRLLMGVEPVRGRACRGSRGRALADVRGVLSLIAHTGAVRRACIVHYRRGHRALRLWSRRERDRLVAGLALDIHDAAFVPGVVTVVTHTFRNISARCGRRWRRSRRWLDGRFEKWLLK